MTRVAIGRAWLAAAVLAAVPASAGEVLDRIAAVVNEDVILLSEVDRQCQDSLAQVPGGLPLDEELGRKRQIRRQALERLIDELLLAQQIRGAAIDVDDEQVARYIARLREDNKMSEAQFEAALVHEGKSLDAFKAEVRKMLERQRLMGRELAGKVNVTEKEVEEYYRTTYLEGGGVHKVRASHILFALPESATAEQDQQVRARGEAVLKAIQGGADFAETAKKESDDPSGPLGGDLGWFRRGDMVAAFETAAFALKKGEMTDGLVRTQYGYHIIQVTGTAEEAPPALDQVSEDIRRRLMIDKQERFQRNWLEDLRRKAFVEIKL
ncbi:MAG TPA: peptidylprolyl isomerase [Myxococcota bacterium]|nr:peptidylprolyl isomerase [Myxococcota bacterium]HRY93205.1 peptidylprolyl isomerase [Myxococcota bacterium]HSA22818.1 peptidylprolyl isomerase [Myxococcota bacterium]